MTANIAKKLKIKDGFLLLTVNAPSGFGAKLGLPGVRLKTKGNSYDQVHWFVKTASQVETEISFIMELLKENIICWIYYPKSSSGLQTDLTRDKGWEPLLKKNNLQWISLVSFDDTWSAFAIRLRHGDSLRKNRLDISASEIKYIDAKTKSVQLPEEFATRLNQKAELREFFEKLAYTNRKEYVLWIVSAKKKETRDRRIEQSLEMLGKHWKNPSNS